MKKKNQFYVLLSLVKMIKPMAGWMLLAVVLGVAGFIAAAAIPVMGAIGLEWGIAGELSGRFGLLIWILVLCAILRGVLRYGEQACNHYIAFKILAHIRDLVFGKLRTLAPAKLEGRQKGDLISLITSDVELLEVFFAHTISPVCISLVCAVIFIAAGGFFHWSAAVLLFISYACVGILLPWCISRASASAGTEYRRKAGKLNAYVLESIRGLRESLQYQQISKRMQGMEEKTRQLADQEYILKKYQARTSGWTAILITLFTALMVLLCRHLVLSGALSFRAVPVLVVLQASTFGPFVALANLGTGLAQTLGAAERLNELMAEKPVVEEVAQGLTSEFEGAAVSNLSFSYEKQKILDGLDLTVSKGEILGIQGRSGCGKSTLLKLLMRFWDSDSGTVTVSGKDIASISTSSLRDMESYMTQDTILFRDTIASNLRIAKPEASMEELEEACRKASIHDFIMSLPKGYETPVGELGSTLSGGEKQRLGLARVFLHDAPFMLLDEPTSNLDALNEGAVLRAIDDSRENKTIILISHRKGTLSFADRIVLMEGNHES